MSSDGGTVGGQADTMDAKSKLKWKPKGPSNVSTNLAVENVPSEVKTENPEKKKTKSKRKKPVSDSSAHTVTTMATDNAQPVTASSTSSSVAPAHVVPPPPSAVDIATPANDPKQSKSSKGRSRPDKALYVPKVKPQQPDERPAVNQPQKSQKEKPKPSASVKATTEPSGASNNKNKSTHSSRREKDNKHTSSSIKKDPQRSFQEQLDAQKREFERKLEEERRKWAEAQQDEERRRQKKVANSGLLFNLFADHSSSKQGGSAAGHDQQGEKKQKEKQTPSHKKSKPLSSYEHFKAAEAELKTLMSSKSMDQDGVSSTAVATADVNTLLQKAKEAWVTFCMEDVKQADRKGGPNRLWQLYYKQFQQVLSRLSATTNVSATVKQQLESAKIRSQLRSILNEATEVFSDLASSIWQSSDVENEPIQFGVDSPGRRCCMQCFTILGDLERYRSIHDGPGSQSSHEAKSTADFSLAEKQYKEALKIFPYEGKVFNQLAVISGYKEDMLSTIYFYFRALCSAFPFPSRENLLLLMEKARVELNEVSTSAQLSGSRGQFKLLILRFTRCCAMLFSRTSLEMWEDAQKHCVRDLHQWLLAESNLTSSFPYVQIVVINICNLLYILRSPMLSQLQIITSSSNEWSREISCEEIQNHSVATLAFSYAQEIIQRFVDVIRSARSPLLPAVHIYLQWLALHRSLCFLEQPSQISFRRRLTRLFQILSPVDASSINDLNSIQLSENKMVTGFLCLGSSAQAVNSHNELLASGFTTELSEEQEVIRRAVLVRNLIHELGCDAESVEPLPTASRPSAISPNTAAVLGNNSWTFSGAGPTYQRGRSSSLSDPNNVLPQDVYDERRTAVHRQVQESLQKQHQQQQQQQQHRKTPSTGRYISPHHGQQAFYDDDYNRDIEYTRAGSGSMESHHRQSSGRSMQTKSAPITPHKPPPSSAWTGPVAVPAPVKPLYPGPPPFIVIDGPNVAMRHGKKKQFSSRGIEIAINYWKAKGHEVICFVPDYYVDFKKVGELKRAKAANMDVAASKIPDNVTLINNLADEGLIVLTPPQDYDDSYSIQFAKEKNGYIVSNDRYSDHIAKAGDREAQFELKGWIRSHCISYTFAGDTFLPNPDFNFLLPPPATPTPPQGQESVVDVINGTTSPPDNAEVPIPTFADSDIHNDGAASEPGYEEADLNLGVDDLNLEDIEHLSDIDNLELEGS